MTQVVMTRRKWLLRSPNWQVASKIGVQVGAGITAKLLGSYQVEASTEKMVEEAARLQVEPETC